MCYQDVHSSTGKLTCRIFSESMCTTTVFLKHSAVLGREKGQEIYLLISFCLLSRWPKFTPRTLTPHLTPSDLYWRRQSLCGSRWSGLSLGTIMGPSGVNMMVPQSLPPDEREMIYGVKRQGACAETEHIPPKFGYHKT